LNGAAAGAGRDEGLKDDDLGHILVHDLVGDDMHSLESLPSMISLCVGSPQTLHPVNELVVLVTEGDQLLDLALLALFLLLLLLLFLYSDLVQILLHALP
jgi:hypothetical protein